MFQTNQCTTDLSENIRQAIKSLSDSLAEIAEQAARGQPLSSEHEKEVLRARLILFSLCYDGATLECGDGSFTGWGELQPQHQIQVTLVNENINSSSSTTEAYQPKFSRWGQELSLEHLSTISLVETFVSCLHPPTEVLELLNEPLRQLLYPVLQSSETREGQDVGNSQRVIVRQSEPPIECSTGHSLRMCIAGELVTATIKSIGASSDPDYMYTILEYKRGNKSYYITVPVCNHQGQGYQFSELSPEFFRVSPEKAHLYRLVETICEKSTEYPDLCAVLNRAPFDLWNVKKDPSLKLVYNLGGDCQDTPLISSLVEAMEAMSRDVRKNTDPFLMSQKLLSALIEAMAVDYNSHHSDLKPGLLRQLILQEPKLFAHPPSGRVLSMVLDDVFTKVSGNMVSSAIFLVSSQKEPYYFSHLPARKKPEGSDSLNEFSVACQSSGSDLHRILMDKFNHGEEKQQIGLLQHWTFHPPLDPAEKKEILTSIDSRRLARHTEYQESIFQLLASWTFPADDRGFDGLISSLCLQLPELKLASDFPKNVPLTQEATQLGTVLYATLLNRKGQEMPFQKNVVNALQTIASKSESLDLRAAALKLLVEYLKTHPTEMNMHFDEMLTGLNTPLPSEVSNSFKEHWRRMQGNLLRELSMMKLSESQGIKLVTQLTLAPLYNSGFDALNNLVVNPDLHDFFRKEEAWEKIVKIEENLLTAMKDGSIKEMPRQLFTKNLSWAHCPYAFKDSFLRHLTDLARASLDSYSSAPDTNLRDASYSMLNLSALVEPFHSLLSADNDDHLRLYYSHLVKILSDISDTLKRKGESSDSESLVIAYYEFIFPDVSDRPLSIDREYENTITQHQNNVDKYIAELNLREKYPLIHFRGQAFSNQTP